MQKSLGQASSLSFTMSSCLRNHVHGARNGIIFSTEARILHVRSLFQFEQSVVSVHIKAQVSRCRLRPAADTCSEAADKGLVGLQFCLLLCMNR